MVPGQHTGRAVLTPYSPGRVGASFPARKRRCPVAKSFLNRSTWLFYRSSERVRLDGIVLLREPHESRRTQGSKQHQAGGTA
jgi:hypothetical protein